MLFDHLSEQRPGVDLEQIVCTLNERVEVDRFVAAWREIARRHAGFRTRFHWGDGGGRPVQEVLPDAPLRLTIEDWSGAAPSERESRLAEWLATDRASGFDLDAEPPVRVTLIRFGDLDHRCVWSFHHILFDGRSFPIVLGEVFALYAALRDDRPLPPAAPDRFPEFLEWLEHRDRSGDASFWREELTGIRSTSPLPFGGTGTVGDTTAGEEMRRLTPESSRALRELAERSGATMATVLQGAWGLLLARHAGAEEAVFGVIRAGRAGTIPGMAEVPGVFINTLPARVRIDPDAPLDEWLAGLRERQVASRPHEHASLAEIHRWAEVAPGKRLFDSIFVFDRATLDSALRKIGGDVRGKQWANRRFDLLERTGFPLNLYGYDEPELLLRLAYDRDRFGDLEMARVLDQLVALLENMAAAAPPMPTVGALSLLGPAEAQRVLVEWNATHRPIDSDRCVHELIEAQVARTPGAVAITAPERSLTYRELDREAAGLATRLRELGVGPERRVGISLGSSAELPVAVLAVLKAGGAYVPLDPDYPMERLRFMARDAGLTALISHAGADELSGELVGEGVAILTLGEAGRHGEPATGEPAPGESATPEGLAYMIYTSGSTGRPKAVLVEHRNVVSFFAAMDERIPHEPAGTWLAVTSLSFDISVLELLWPLTHGFKVVIAGPSPATPRRDPDGGAAPARVHAGSDVSPVHPVAPAGAAPGFSLFYFASEGGEAEPDVKKDPYRLLMDGARFADERGFEAVWVPERHFHAFGGLYPNPATVAAALATCTRRLEIRAGSVVLPLHHPARVAEEWALVDNLSDGRVGISFASGWQPNDFVLAPEAYADRKRVMAERIETVRRLWRGEAVAFPGPTGESVEVRTLPRPVQAELPFWITSAGNPDSCREAGKGGANLLTHLLGQTVEELAERIGLYREARAAAGHHGPGRVTLMLHTFVGEDDDAVRAAVREPMKEYLRSSIGLVRGFADLWTAYRRARGGTAPRASGREFDALSPEDLDSLVEFAFERYFESSGLFGSQARCLELVERLHGVGVDEIACLIDFGVPTAAALAHLENLDRLRLRCARDLKQPRDRSTGRGVGAPASDSAHGPGIPPGLGKLIREHEVTHFQCTPSLARMLLADSDVTSALAGLRVMLVGGEALPGGLASELGKALRGPLLNMYGPTETTVWSSVHEVDVRDPVDAGSVPSDAAAGTVSIGRPIPNTRLYVLDEGGRPTPAGVAGELHIGGPGVTRGYHRRPELTDERFVADPFDPGGGRLYRTGDLVRYRADGVVEFLGRTDHQVKIRGHRVELGEVEAVLAAHPSVEVAVVHPWHREAGDTVLVAWVVLAGRASSSDLPAGSSGTWEALLRDHAAARLPPAMVPARVVALDHLPLTPNGKIDRGALPSPAPAAQPATSPTAQPAASPTAQLAGSAPENGDGEGHAAPATALESLVAEAWEGVLGIAKVRRGDHFFELGGNSLTTIQVASRLRDALGIELPLGTLFEAPTLAGLASRLEERLLEAADPAALEAAVSELGVGTGGQS